jgi:hypothetical protein
MHPVLGLAPAEQKAELFAKANEEGGPEIVYPGRVRLDDGAVLTTSLRLSVVMAMEPDAAVVLKVDCDEKPIVAASAVETSNTSVPTAPAM